MSSLIRFSRDGGVRAVWEDRLANFFQKAFGSDFSAQRRRASIIMTVEEGPRAGCFYADMSYLADLTGHDCHQLCLYPPRKLESECKADEVRYVQEHFIGAEI